LPYVSLTEYLTGEMLPFIRTTVRMLLVFSILFLLRLKHSLKRDSEKGFWSPGAHRKIVLIGDSTMSRTAEALHSNMRGCRLIAEQKRCNFSSYFGMNHSSLKVWPPPRDSGPLYYGRKNPGCQDCRGCNSRQWICSGNVVIIFIGIEFAKDYTLQIFPYNTTQESIILGHLIDLQNIVLVIFNTGLHDLAIAPRSVNKDGLLFYMKNLSFYCSLLRSSLVSHRIIWLSTSSVVEAKIMPKYRKITNNENIKSYNRAAARIMGENDINILDTFSLSQKRIYRDLNMDGVHWGDSNQSYYKDIALIVQCFAFLELNETVAPWFRYNSAKEHADRSSCDVRGQN